MENILNTLKKEEPNSLFIIAKSHNKNILNFISDTNNHLKINPLWWMYEKKNTPKETLNYIEKTMAYGIKYIETNPDKTIFNLIGYPNIKLELIKKKDEYIVLYKNYRLLGLYIYVNQNSLLGSVKGIDIYYYNKNKLIKEYIINN